MLNLFLRTLHKLIGFDANREILFTESESPHLKDFNIFVFFLICATALVITCFFYFEIHSIATDSILILTEERIDLTIAFLFVLSFFFAHFFVKSFSPFERDSFIESVSKYLVKVKNEKNFCFILNYSKLAKHVLYLNFPFLRRVNINETFTELKGVLEEQEVVVQKSFYKAYYNYQKEILILTVIRDLTRTFFYVYLINTALTYLNRMELILVRESLLTLLIVVIFYIAGYFWTQSSASKKHYYLKMCKIIKTQNKPS